jgi:hypothetical protein
VAADPCHLFRHLFREAQSLPGQSRPLLRCPSSGKSGSRGCSPPS